MKLFLKAVASLAKDFGRFLLFVAFVGFFIVLGVNWPYVVGVLMGVLALAIIVVIRMVQIEDKEGKK